ncbi:MAG: flavoprotein, partial [Actinomycetota bacterium]|nr:flavoprotein [Actinomycetota bacterium]
TLLREVTITGLGPPADVPGRLRITGTGRDGAPVDLHVDAVAAATGFRPDLDMLLEVRLDLDAGVEAPARLAPLIDPNLHSCGTVPPHGHRHLSHPDEGFYLAGMKSYGRAPTFLLATGYEQVRSIAAALAGDTDAADSVQLHLPSTGVCSTDLGAREAAETSGVGFPTGSQHGWSADDSTAAACCGSMSQPVTVGAPPSDS